MIKIVLTIYGILVILGLIAFFWSIYKAPLADDYNELY